MKKLLLFLVLLGMQAITFACNLCIGHSGERLLRKRAPHFEKCDCNCYEQGISKHVDGHRCLKCGHRVMPYSIKKEGGIKGLVKKLTKDDANLWSTDTLQRYYKPSAEQSKIDLGKIFLVDQLD